METQRDTEEAVYAALKRRAQDEEFGRLGRWLFLGVVVLVGVGVIAFALSGFF